MGFGDEIMASGLARGARARGKRIAFGDGKRILWGPHCEAVFRFNPNIARPGSEGAHDLEWIAHYKGARLYNRPGGRGWIWNMSFRPVPGEIFFNAGEELSRRRLPEGFALIEPNVPSHKSVAPNKQWPIDRYQAVADALRDEGIEVIQLEHGGARYRLARVRTIGTATFRDALKVVSRAALFVGPEGGMHHAAAAFDVPGVVIFGGFIPPEVTGYAVHANLSAGGPACGSTSTCVHCREALDAITVEAVLTAAMERRHAGKVRDNREVGEREGVA